MNPLIRNLYNCLKYTKAPTNTEPAHIVLVTCTIPLVNHTSHEDQSPESLLIQDMFRLSTLSVISPFTKNILTSCGKMKHPTSLNHPNLLLFFNFGQNILIENQQNEAALLHPTIAELVKMNNANLTNLKPTAAASASIPSSSVKSMSTPISVPSPSAFPPPTKFTKDNSSINAQQNPIKQQSAATKVASGKMNTASPVLPSNMPNNLQQQHQQQHQQQQQKMMNQMNAAGNNSNTNASINLSTNAMQQKTASNQINNNSLLTNQQTQQNQINLNQQLQQQQQQQQQQAQMLKAKQSPFIPSGSLLGQPQLQQNSSQQQLLLQQQQQLKNMYQSQQQPQQAQQNINNNKQMNPNMMNVNAATMLGVGNFNSNLMGNNMNNMGMNMNNVNVMNSSMGLQNNPGMNNSNLQQLQYLEAQKQQQYVVFSCFFHACILFSNPF